MLTPDHSRSYHVPRISPIAETLEERGRSLDVGEEESDRPGRQAGQGGGFFYFDFLLHSTSPAGRRPPPPLRLRPEPAQGAFQFGERDVFTQSVLSQWRAHKKQPLQPRIPCI